ncbi:hypothetical protein AFEL58S_01621 [Afipia felis]
MSNFPAPARMQKLYDDLKSRPELERCAITMEEFVLDKDAKNEFPVFDWDTCRVWVRLGEYTINVAGCIQQSAFQYRAHAYHGPSPWDVQAHANIDEREKIVEFIIGKFDLVP